jgi:hypothetical protein
MIRVLVLKPQSQNFAPSSPLSQPFDNVKMLIVGWGVALRGRRPREIGYVSALPSPQKSLPACWHRPLDNNSKKISTQRTQRTQRKAEKSAWLIFPRKPAPCSLWIFSVSSVFQFFSEWQATSNTSAQSQSSRRRLPRRISFSSACGCGCDPPSIRP